MNTRPFLASGLLALQSLFGECCPPGVDENPNRSCCFPDASCGSLGTARHCSKVPCPPACWGGSLDLSFLLWQAKEEGLAFALKNRPHALLGNYLANIDADVANLDFGVKPAFKIDAALEFPNCWDLNSRWTCFYGKSRAEDSLAAIASTGRGLFPLWVLPQSALVANSVYGRAGGVWTLHFNTLDLELGANALYTQQFALRLHGGLKGLSILQRYVATYSGGVGDAVSTLVSARADMKSTLYGVGPRFGASGEWKLRGGAFIASSFAGALSLCHFDIKRADFDNARATATGSPLTQTSRFKNSFYMFRPSIEALLGFGWNTCAGCRNQYEVGFSAAYEVQYYWEQNMLPQLITNQISFLPFMPRRDLSFQGLTATLRLGF